MARSIGIRVYKGDALDAEHIFERDIIKIGRLASAHLRLEDTKVSRIHAVIDISQSRDEVSIIDMGSAEGTRVNSEKVSRVRLKHGDEIGLGDSRLVVVLEPAEIAAMAGDETAAAAAPESDASELTISEEGTNVDFAPGPMSEFSMPPSDAIVPSPFSDLDADTTVAETVQPVIQPSMEVNFLEEPAEPAIAAPAIAAPAMATPANDAPELPAPSAPDVAASAPDIAAAAVPQMAYAPLPPIPVDPITPTNRYVEVSLRWGGTVTEVQRVRNIPKFTIGVEDKCDLFVPLEDVGGGAVHDLLTAKDNQWAVHILPGMSGNVQRKGQSPTPLSQMGGDFPLSDDMRLEIAVGPFTLELQPVSRSRVIPIAPFFDALAMNIALVTMFAFTSLISVVSLLPNDLDDSDSLSSNAADFKLLILKPPPKNNAFLDRLNKSKAKAAAAAKQSGKAGSKKKKTKDTSPTRMAVKVKKKTDEEVVASKLSALFGADGNAGIASVFGANVGGGDLEAALGGIQGNRVATAAGEGGLGIRGGAVGGGGTGISTLGIGKIGTRGRGDGDAKFGSAEGGLGKKVDRDVRISQGTPVIRGSLDKEIIRRVVREHMAQIRYCYERELTRTPGLFGKIVMRWIISGKGRVSRSTVASTTMKNKQVESCIAGKVRTWTFPKPKGGGIVLVNYPFVFKQSG